MEFKEHARRDRVRVAIAEREQARPVAAVFLATGIWLLVTAALMLAGCSGEVSPSPERPTLYVITSPNCAPCLQDYPMVQKIMDSGLVTVRVVVADTDPDRVRELGVKSLPTYILFRGCHEVWRCHQAGVAYKFINEMFAHRSVVVK